MGHVGSSASIQVSSSVVYNAILDPIGSLVSTLLVSELWVGGSHFFHFGCCGVVMMEC